SEKRDGEIGGGVLGEPAHGGQGGVENAIGGVVEDHEDGVDAIARGGPQPLAGIHGAAVADEADHRPLGQCELHADGGGQAPADAAAAQAEIALRVIAADELTDAGGGGERLLEAARVLRRPLCGGGEQGGRRHGRRGGGRGGLGGGRVASGGNRAGRGRDPRGGGAARPAGQAFAHGGGDVRQRGLWIA